MGVSLCQEAQMVGSTQHLANVLLRPEPIQHQHRRPSQGRQLAKSPVQKLSILKSDACPMALGPKHVPPVNIPIPTKIN